MRKTRTYYTDEAIIPVPPGFVDRSAHVLEWKTPDGDKIALLVHRQQLDPEQLAGGSRSTAFDALVKRETKDYASRFAGLRWEREDDEDPDVALPVRRRAFRFKHEQDVLYQCQAFVLLDDRVLVLTAAAQANHRAEVDRLLDEAIAGLKVWDE